MASLLLEGPLLDEKKLIQLPVEFAEAVAVSTRAFCLLAQTHDQFVKLETAARLNEKGSARTF